MPVLALLVLSVLPTAPRHFSALPAPSEHGLLHDEHPAPHADCNHPCQVGYVSSWSAYAAWRRAHPHAPDPLPAFQQRLLEAVTADGSNPERLTKVTPLGLLIGVRHATHTT
jgi:hypothetical protein